VKDRFVLRDAHEFAQFGQGYRTTVQRRNGKQQQSLDVRPDDHRETHPDQVRLHQRTRLHIAEHLAANSRLQSAIDRIYRNPTTQSLVSLHVEVPDVIGSLQEAVDVVEMRSAFEHPFHIQGDLAAHIRVGPVDLGHHGLQHRRAGRHFHDLDASSCGVRDRREDLARLDRDLVTGPAPVALAEQLHLDVSLPRGLAQVVVPHEPVEIER
jgi:hypothetical protein